MAHSKLKIDKRRKEILDILRRDGRVYVTQLSRELGVTAVTVRCDLDALEHDGYLVRMQGGAVYSNRNYKDAPTATQKVANVRKKEAIARKISEIINDGDTIFINSGTTTQLIAAELRGLRNLNIVTNSISVALTLGEIASFRVMLLGGEINSEYAFTYGADAEEKLSRYHADWAILSVDGVSSVSGITTYHAEEAVIDRIMISHSDNVLIAADESKIGRVGFLRVCDSSETLTLVTNDCDKRTETDAILNKGMRVISVSD